MTKKLEELFNLSPKTRQEDEEAVAAKIFIDENKETIEAIDSAIDKIDTALPAVRDLDTADSDLDDLAKLAKDNFEELMTLGMNVEARFAGPILQTASTLLGHAITAKQAKIDKKLRMVQLQLQKAKLDQAKKDDDETPIDGKGVVMDRNALLKEILGKNKPAEK